MQVSTIQVGRAIAAWMVVYHHYYQIYEIETYGYGWFIKHKGGFGVDIFFIISGFIMYLNLNYKNYCAFDFFLRRVSRIVPAYWFYTFLLIFIDSYVIESSLTAFNLKSLILSLFFFPHQNPSGSGIFPFLTVGWTLNFEMFFYFCLSLCIFVNNKRKFILCGALFVLLPLVNYSEIPLIWRYGSILGDEIVYEFIAGIFLGYIYISFPNIFNSKCSPLVGFVIVLLGFFILLVEDKRQDGFWLFSAFAIVFGLLSLEKYKDNKLLVPIIFLGNISYSTYLCHFLIIICLKKYYVPNAFFEEGVFLCLLFFLITGISFVSYHVVEKGSSNAFYKIKINCKY